MLGGIVSIVDRPRSTFSRSEHQPFLTYDRYAVAKFSKSRVLEQSSGGKYIMLTYVSFWAHVKIASRIVSYRVFAHRPT